MQGAVSAEQTLMDNVKAIGFDLFNTLITAEPAALREATSRLIRSFAESGLALDPEVFKKPYREAALRFITEARAEGRETHNRFWISAALASLGHEIKPEDPRIARAVEAYFSAFFDYCRLIPGTKEMLAELQGHFRLGLLSNFTHAPAAKGLVEYLGLAPYFDPILISGEIGYRKPHALVFELLVEKLGLEKSAVIYIGDDPEPDILGAQGAGIRPVWMTYLRDRNLPVMPSTVTGHEGLVGDEVPRISEWNDLFTLLKIR
jgi:putative hydrolase of the HAD superfamily